MTRLVSPARLALLAVIKVDGRSSIQGLADRSGSTYEAARQHVMALVAAGYLEARPAEGEVATPGRPAQSYGLTAAAEALFPKSYEALAVELIDAVAAEAGPEVLRAVLTRLTEARLAAWRPRLAKKSLDARLALLTELYAPADPHMEVGADADGPYLIERNCPFLEVARRRPQLCSVSVSTLRGLLGREVVREKSFQRGDGCCVFRVRGKIAGEAPGFELES